MDPGAAAPASPQYWEDRAAARIRAFELVRDVQTDLPGVVDEIASLVEHAERKGWSEVVRAGLLGEAISAWLAADGSAPEAVERFLERSSNDGDHVMVALALAIRAGRGATGDDPAVAAAADADLARATVLLENAEGGTLERISAHTGCGIAFGDRWLWELGDDQYALALELAQAEELGTADFLLAAILYNRAEVQVSWASTLRQLGDANGVVERLRIWEAASATANSVSMPDVWSRDLAAFGVLLAASAGEDRAAEARAMLGDESPGRLDATRPVGHLLLAAALSDATAGRAGAAATAEQAIRSLDPNLYPHEYDLALYVGAELEAAGGHGAGLRCAQRQLVERWTSRLAALGSMQSRIHAESLSADYDLLSRHAHLDDLTGVGNRRALERYLVALSARSVESIALLMTDVDDFKTVNDRYGHAAGDAALIEVARVLERSIRPADIAVRLGGDEFTVVLADTDIEVARRRAETLLQTIEQHSWGDISPDLHLTLSIGVTAGDAVRIQELASQADAALYEAKAGGGHRIVCRQAV
ncbi:MAG: GGDEF domain-containing protein [Acidimicrobiales bacterium]